VLSFSSTLIPVHLYQATHLNARIFIMSAARTVFVIGSGPGISRSVVKLFAENRYSNVALIARRAEQLAEEEKALKSAVGDKVKVKTYALDIADSGALTKALSDAEAELGQAECIFFNAARVLPSELLKHDIKETEYDFKITVSALYTVAQQQIPKLAELAKKDSTAVPSFIVTTSNLPQEPNPFVFSLSIVKAAQRNLVQSLNMVYGEQGIYFGLINVRGQVSPDHEIWNPPNIAKLTWDWFSQLKEKPVFELVI
jgi:NAD(P)-dependent dehydrogenase (short-subunit alcohol dehydrogenase family)